MSPSSADPSRAHELTYRAVRALAAGTTSLGERLRDAWQHNLSMLELSGMPGDDLAERYRDLADYFNVNPHKGRLFVEDLPEHEQMRLAGEIVDLFSAVFERLENDPKAK